MEFVILKKKFKKSEEEFNSSIKDSPNNIKALFYCGLMNFKIKITIKVKFFKENNQDW